MNKVKHKRPQPVLKNPNRICTVCNKDYKAVAPLQKTCSEECRKLKNKQNSRKFRENNPNKQKEYNKKRKPNYWKEKSKKEREEVLSALGSKCVVCGHNNSYHLHIDYIPTMIGTGHRHPRHKKFILDNIKDFRILCANHHYELTITGKIEGTNITQKRHHDEQ